MPSLIISFLLLFSSHSQFNIEGKVVDNNNEPLIGATVLIEGTTTGVATNVNGLFQLSVNETGTYIIIVRHIGYQTIKKEVQVPQSELILIQLSPASILSSEIVMTASPAGVKRSYQPSNALTLENLQNLSAETLGDALSREPGLAVRSFGSAPSRPVIRGFDGDRVVILENGERMGDLSETAADHSVSMDMDAAERIEIIRGPAGFLYGSGAIGGVVNLINNDIPVNWKRGISGRLAGTGMSINNGGTGFGRITYGIQTTAVTGRLSYRNSADIDTPAGKLLGTFNSNLNGSFGAAFQNVGFQGGMALSFLDQTYGLPESIDNPDESVELSVNKINLSGLGILQTGGIFDETHIRFNLTQYGHQEKEIQIEDDGSIDEELELDFKSNTISGSLLFIRSDSQDRNLAGAIGLNLLSRDLLVGGGEGLTPNARNISVAMFGYKDYKINTTVSFQTGLRFDYKRLEASGNDNFGTPEDPARSSLTFSGALGFNFQPLNGLEFGVQGSRTFRAPSVEELFVNAAHLGAGAYEIGDPNLKDEIGYGVDIISKYSHSLFSFEASAFYYLIDNFIIYQPTGEIHQPSSLPIFVYEGDQAIYSGFETTATIFPVRFATISLGIDYVQANRTGDDTPLPFIPPLRLRFKTDINIAQWQAGLGVRHILKQDRVADNEEVTDGYSLVELSFGYRFDSILGRHLISARADNLFNVSYRDHLSRIEDRNALMPGRGFSIRYQLIF